MTAVIERVRLPEAVRSATGEQTFVAAGQMAAGVGTLGFSLVMARMLSPGQYAELASFLALYLVLSLPASAVTAAAALSPRRVSRIAPHLLTGGMLAGAAIALSSPWSAPLLHIPIAMVVGLGVGAPAVTVLALLRGRLYATRRHSTLVASLLAEPVARLVLGALLALAIGGVGGAFAVAAGGYCALEIARRRRPAGRHVLVDEQNLGAPGWTAACFIALVVVQCQDLVIANATLSREAAGQFAVLSTLGGLAVFATFTVPLVLLPRAARGEGGYRSALLLTAGIGGAAVLVSVAAAAPIVDLLFGSRYSSISAVLGAYMAAMALLGLVRVVVAHRSAIGAGASSVAIICAGAGVQAASILQFGHDARAVAFCTVGSVAGMTGALGVAELTRMAATRGLIDRIGALLRQPATLFVLSASAAGFVLRIIVPRGLWLDEATSVFQARMSFSAMLHNLRTTDVHPPLYFSVLWVSVRWLGSGELAVRMPSILAGTLVIPALYLVAREAYDRRTAVAAAALGSVAPIMVWYSQEARMYALLMLFGVLAIWAQIRVLRRPSVFAWVVYAAATIAIAWTQYFGLLQVGVQQVAFIVVMWSRWRRGEPVKDLLVGWAATAAVILLSLVPLYSFAHQQFVVNQTAGKGFGAPQQERSASSLSNNHLSIYAAIANVIWAVWGYHSNATMALLAALWPLGMLLALGLLGRRRQGVSTLLAAAVVVPGVSMFALGLFKQNLFDIRYLSTAVPLLFVLLARFAAGVPRRAWAAGSCCLLLGVSLVGGLVDQQYNGSNPRTYDFRGAVRTIDAEAVPGAVLLYSPADLEQVLAYYNRGVNLLPAGSTSPLIGRAPEVFVMASPTLMQGGTDQSTLGGTLTRLERHDGLPQVRQLPNVTVWIFRR